MTLTVSFRVVGLFCYFENLQLENIEPTSTVREIMRAIVSKKPEYQYVSRQTEKGKLIIDSMSYLYSDSSTQPFNTSKEPHNGLRDLSNFFPELGSVAPSLVWQYYRSVTGTIGGKVCEIKLLQRGQPSFADTSINFYDPFFGELPPEDTFQVKSYNLTWRLVQIQLSEEKRILFAKS